MVEKEREKAEDFIGWRSEDGELEVIGIHDKDKHGQTLFKVTCTECSKDKELFPDDYFVSPKSSLIKGSKPCGCSKKPKWKDWQFLILARRVGEKKGFIVNGFAEGFHGHHTKLNLECLKDGHKWTASINAVIKGGRGCPNCKYELQKEQLKTPEHIALQNCIAICKEMDYDVIGFVGGYKNQNSRFEYICKIHRKQNVNYNSFVNRGSRCKGCWKDKQKEIGNGNGFYLERKDKQDFLYTIDFNNQFIKIGRSFDIKQRISSLKQLSKIKNIKKLRIFSGTHEQIYNLEQEIHNELRERNFQYYQDWSTECFDKDCLFILNNILDNCELQEI